MDHHHELALVTTRLYSLAPGEAVDLDRCREEACLSAVRDMAERELIPTRSCTWEAYGEGIVHDDLDGGLTDAGVRMYVMGIPLQRRELVAKLWMTASSRGRRPLLILHHVDAAPISSFAPGELSELMGR